MKKPIAEYRVIKCEKSNSEVVQMLLTGENEWLCLHEDTIAKDAKTIKRFRQKGLIT